MASARLRINNSFCLPHFCLGALIFEAVDLLLPTTQVCESVRKFPQRALSSTQKPCAAAIHAGENARLKFLRYATRPLSGGAGVRYSKGRRRAQKAGLRMS